MKSLRVVVRRILRNFSVLLTGNTTATVLNLAAFGLNARALGVSGIGVLAIVQAYGTIISRLANFDTWQPVIKLLSDASHKQTSTANAREIVTIGFMCDIIAGSLSSLIGVIAVCFFASRLNIPSEVKTGALIFAFSMFFLTNGTAIGIIRYLDKFHYIVITAIFTALVALLMSALFFYFEVGVEWYIGGYGVVGALNGLILVLISMWLYKNQGWPDILSGGRPNISRSLTSVFLSYTTFTSSVQAINVIRQNGDVIVLSAMTNTAAVGIYTAAVKLASLVNKIADPARAAVFPEIARSVSSGDRESYSRLFWILLFIGVLSGTLITIAYVGLGPMLIRIFAGSDYSGSYYPLIILVAANSLYGAGFMIISYVQLLSSPRALAVLYVLAFLFFVPTIAIAIPMFGVSGAGAAQLGFATVWFGLGAAFVAKQLRRSV